jgi:hypothetical protein
MLSYNQWLNEQGALPGAGAAAHYIAYTQAYQAAQPSQAPAQAPVTPPNGSFETPPGEWAIGNLSVAGGGGGQQNLKPAKSKDETPKNRIYNIPFLQAFRHKLQGTLQSGEIGLEIECEGMNLFETPVSWWTCHQDGSLRAVKDHPPVEYVLRKPISREDVPTALSYLSKKLKETGSTISESHRTSVHVHLNCQRLTLKQIYQIWCLYTVFEEILVDFSGPDRPGNLFCLSSKQAEYQVHVLEQAIQSENFNEMFSDSIRYTSCNTASLGKFGSLEFRSMRGTVDQGLIQAWVDLLCLIRDKALEYDSPKDIVDDFQGLNSEAFTKKIFNERPDLMAIIKSRPDRHKILWDGLRLMRDVALAVSWEKMDPELNKKKAQKAFDVLEVGPKARWYKRSIHEDDSASPLKEYFEDGGYWVINMTPDKIMIPRLNSIGMRLNDEWMVGQYNRSLFNTVNQYCGQERATEEELEIEL